MQPWFGLHLPSYTHPDAPPAELFDLVGEALRMVEGSAAPA